MLIRILLLATLVFQIASKPAAADPYIENGYIDNGSRGFTARKLWFAAELQVGEFMPIRYAKEMGPLPKQFKWQAVKRGKPVNDSRIVQLQSNPLNPPLSEMTDGNVIVRFPVIFNVADSLDLQRYKDVVETRIDMHSLIQRANQSGEKKSLGKFAMQLLGMDIVEQIKGLHLTLEKSVLTEKNVIPMLVDKVVEPLFWRNGGSALPKRVLGKRHEKSSLTVYNHSKNRKRPIRVK